MVVGWWHGTVTLLGVCTETPELGAPGLPLACLHGHVVCGGLQTQPAGGNGLGVVGEGGGVGPSRDRSSRPNRGLVGRIPCFRDVTLNG